MTRGLGTEFYGLNLTIRAETEDYASISMFKIFVYNTE